MPEPIEKSVGSYDIIQLDKSEFMEIVFSTRLRLSTYFSVVCQKIKY